MKWEYKLEMLGLSMVEAPARAGDDLAARWDSAVEELNSSGRDGWEAVALVRPDIKMMGGGLSEPLVLMKRPIE